MIISTLLSLQDPSAVGIRKNTMVNIDTPLDSNGRKRYRHLYYLYFTVDPSADGLVIDAAASLLQGFFHDYALHLTANNLYFQTQAWEGVTEAGSSLPNLVKVHLTHPWRLQSVSTARQCGIEVMRLDGDAVCSEPTISGNANAVLTKEFIGQDFAVRKVASFPVAQSRKTLNAHKPQALAGRNTGALTGELERNSAPSGLDVMNGSRIDSASSYGITTIKLQSLPTGPRILLGEIGHTPASEDRLLSIWQLAGEQTQVPICFFEDNDGWHDALQQIQKACDRYFAAVQQGSAGPSAHLYLPIVFESDTPVRLQLSELRLEYHLLRRHFDGIEGKHVLKFSGTTIEKRQLPFSLPQNSTVKRATLTLKSSLKNGFPMARPFADINTSHLYTGVDMREGLGVAARIRSAQPEQIDCIALAVLPLADEVTAVLQIVQEVQGGPNGSVLAKTQLKLQQGQNRRWSVAQFATPVLLDSGDYWLRLTIRRGRLFWFGKDGDGAVHIQGKETPAKKLNTLILLNQSGLSSQQNSKNVDVSIDVAGTPASLLEKSPADMTFDLAAGLNEHYGMGKPAPVQLFFTSGSKGNLAVMAVEVIYGRGDS